LPIIAITPDAEERIAANGAWGYPNPVPSADALQLRIQTHAFLEAGVAGATPLLDSARLG